MLYSDIFIGVKGSRFIFRLLFFMVGARFCFTLFVSN